VVHGRTSPCAWSRQCYMRSDLAGTLVLCLLQLVVLPNLSCGHCYYPALFRLVLKVTGISCDEHVLFADLQDQGA
jgi:hypothetical protein